MDPTETVIEVIEVSNLTDYTGMLDALFIRCGNIEYCLHVIAGFGLFAVICCLCYFCYKFFRIFI